MPWRGPKKTGEFPSLGPAVADWLDDLFPDESLTQEQYRKLVWWYRIDPDTGQRRFRRAQWMGPKGVGKSPEAARLALAEHSGPVAFNGWDAAGLPVGVRWPNPVVQIAAVSEDQADNTYGALLELLTAGHVADELGLDAGQTRILRKGQPAARIDAVTASAGTREGQRVTFAVLDETHLWTPQNGGKKLAATIRRNAAKMGGTTVETTNAYDPALESVAQATDDAAGQKTPGLYQWKPQAPYVASLANRREVKRALRKVYVDAHWIDLERLIDEMHDPDTTDADARRYYLNEIVRGADAAFDRDEWTVLADPSKVVADKEKIALGFDGARYHDATALVGCRLADMHLFEVGVWEKPPATTDDAWEVPADEVSAAVDMAFDRWRVQRFYADPPYWEDVVDAWAGRHGKAVTAWWTGRPKPMAYAVRAFHHLIRAGELTHDGSDALTRHVLNAQRRSTMVRDDEGRFMWTVAKESPKSPRKIDAAMAAILAVEAAGDAIAAGALKPKARNVRAYSF